MQTLYSLSKKCLISCLFGALTLVLVGCETPPNDIAPNAIPAESIHLPANDVSSAEATIIADAKVSYQLQPGDVFDVKFYFNPDLNEQLVIGPDNKVALQLIGVIDTAGKSADTLAEDLTTRYTRVLRKPQATVILRKYATPKIYVAGEVNNPAAQALDQGTMTVLQAITQSGGFKFGAQLDNVIVLRHSGHAQPLFYKVDLQAHLNQTAVTDMPLKPYDIVYVPQKRIAAMADFFEEYVSKILPLYRNLGLSVVYNRGQVKATP